MRPCAGDERCACPLQGARGRGGAGMSAFWDGRKVLVTGHTACKGAWLTLWLASMGADVTGVSNEVPTDPSLFALAGVHADPAPVQAEVPHAPTRRGPGHDAGGAPGVRAPVPAARPKVVLPLAAEPFVRRSYEDPAHTWA